MKNRNLDAIKKIKRTRQSARNKSRKMDSLLAAKKIVPKNEKGGSPKPPPERTPLKPHFSLKSRLSRIRTSSRIRLSAMRSFWAGFFSRLLAALRNYLASNYRKLLKYSLLSLSAAAGLAIVFFILCSLIIAHFMIDNAFSRKLDALIPIPAIITDKGIISYSEYLGIYKRLESSSWEGKLEEAASREAEIKLITRAYLDRRGISGDIPDKYLLEKIILEDKEINRIGLARINRIQQSLEKGENFDEIYWRFGDSYARSERITKEASLARLKSDFSSAQIGAVSGILVGSDGYYIVKILDSSAGTVELRYVFIKGKTYSEFIQDELDVLKSWSLAG